MRAAGRSARRAGSGASCTHLYCADRQPWTLDEDVLLDARRLVADKIEHVLDPSLPDPEHPAPPPAQGCGCGGAPGGLAMVVLGLARRRRTAFCVLAAVLPACDACGGAATKAIDTRLAAPALLEPQAGACLDAPATLRWSASAGAVDYIVEIASDEGFARILARETHRATQAAVPDSVAPGPLLWRVTARNAEMQAAGGPSSFVLVRGLGPMAITPLPEPVCGGRPYIQWTDSASDDASARWDLDVSPEGGAVLVHRPGLAQTSSAWADSDPALGAGPWVASVRRHFHGCVSDPAVLPFAVADPPGPPGSPSAEWHGCGPWHVRLAWQSPAAAFEVETTDPTGAVATIESASSQLEFDTDRAGAWRWRVRVRDAVCAGAWADGPPAGVAQGAAWERVQPDPPSFAPRSGHAVAVSDDGATMWVMAGDASGDVNDVWSSPDGRAWTRVATAPFASRRWAAGAYFDSRLWVGGGNVGAGSTNFGDVWFSRDSGATWTEAAHAAFTARHSPAAAMFGGRLWVVAGEGPNCNSRSDVWSTADGIQWTQETAAAGFPGRDWHTLTAFGGRLWVTGGIHRDAACEPSYLDDVWSSADGRAWTLESAGRFPARAGHTAAAWEGKLWILGGTHAWPQATQADVRYSEDGRTWCLAAGTAEFSKRYGHGTVVLGGRLWVLGGFDGQYRGDVWVAK